MKENKPSSLERSPHVHADIIKAWADGAAIEYSMDGTYWHSASNPMWSIDTEYRVKPEPKPDYSKFIGVGYKQDWGYCNTTGVYGHEEYICKTFEDNNQFWDNTDIIELVFDGETKQLKDVILKGKAK